MYFAAKLFPFILYIAASGAFNWKTLKEYDFSSMEQIRSDWNILTTPSGSTNNERQQYVDNEHTVASVGDQLRITASNNGQGIQSARLESKLAFTTMQVAGRCLRVEFTARVPTVGGGWPALWMIGEGHDYGGYPNEGEIDVFEWVHDLTDTFMSTLHWNAVNPSTISRTFDLAMRTMNSTYITYGAEYCAENNNEYVQFYYQKPNETPTYSKKAYPSNWTSTWNPSPACSSAAHTGPCTPLAPFDTKMTLIMNMAVGGDWGGLGVNNYDAFNTAVGVSMYVKTVRVIGYL